MQWMQSVVALVDAILSWPVAVLILAFVFERRFRGLLFTQMKRFKAGPFEVEWDRQMTDRAATIPTERDPVEPRPELPHAALPQAAVTAWRHAS